MMRAPAFLWRPGCALASALAMSAAFSAVASSADEVVVYKDPSCGCCGQWAEHMRVSGFVVTEIATSEMARIKREAGVPQSFASCHTAKVAGYVIEGHVPAADVRRLLAERPKAVGIAAPGMPLGAPGMEGPYPAQRYQVIRFDADGGASVFAEH